MMAKSNYGKEDITNVQLKELIYATSIKTMAN